MRDVDWLVVALLVAIIAILYAGFAEIFARLRPRVIYRIVPPPDPEEGAA